MAKLVVLTLGEGDFERTGFPVIFQMEEGKSIYIKKTGHLPANPEIAQNYHDWQLSYLNYIKFQLRLGKKTVEITPDLLTDLKKKAETLSKNLNQWLESKQFSNPMQKLLCYLEKNEVARIAIETSQMELWQLPWHLWDLLEDYPNVEVSISPSAFEQVTSSQEAKSKVLVILGGDDGINLEEDEKKLKSILGDRVQFLVKPNRKELSDRLWEQPWDMLFFSGHSHTEGETGAIYINDTEKLTIDDLRYGLQKAIKSGLQLAIFNSCDGLGLAKDLANLNLPQMIVMREPVPDIVAQEFLKYFLDSFSTGKPFHLAVREAREQLQWLEDRFPCATWLPAIVQNVTAKTFQWKQPSTKWRQICQKMLESRVTSNLLTVKQGVSFTDLDRIYVDLALVERRKQEKRESNIPAEKGSQLYQAREDEATQGFEHQQLLQQILGFGEGKTQGHRVAIIGEPGAGKTTTLQKIARWLLSENQIEDYLPIWISLAELQGQSLEDYLFDTWLKKAIGFPRLTEEVKQEFAKQLEQGRVWLLLDGLDEMPVGDRGMTPQETINRQLRGWMSSARVVVTCRVNLWEADNNALADFETYRMLDFDVSGQEKFIRQFFQQQKSPAKAEKLQAQLKESKYQRLRDLVKNPLRLMLLCTIWETAEAQLPETQAELYQQFVQQIYIWKKDKFPTTESQREELNRGLQTLALRGIENVTSPFRLSHDLVRGVLGDRDDESSLFYRALELGWLNEVGIAAEDVTQIVYSFYHATFQEYFAALAIDDWRFFLNHPIQSPLAPLSKGGINQTDKAPVSKGTNKAPRGKGGWRDNGIYRIFDTQWKQVILLWLGRRNLAKAKKEEFIEALITFEDGCEGFYYYRAYFLAAAGTAEFKEGSRNQEIIRQIIRWSFGEFNPNEWKCTGWNEPKTGKAKIVLRESEREQTIAILLEFIRNTKDKINPWQVIEILGKIGQKNTYAIASLLEMIRNSNDEELRSPAVESLGKIAQGNPEAISSLLDIIRNTKNGTTRSNAVESLVKIAKKNTEAIASLVDIIRNHEIEDIRLSAACCLVQMETQNTEAISGLLDIIRNTNDEISRIKAAFYLGKIDPDNLDAIASLVDIIRNYKPENIQLSPAYYFFTIHPDPKYLDESAKILEFKKYEHEKIRLMAANALWQIGQKNSDCIAVVLEVIRNLKYMKFTYDYKIELTSLVFHICLAKPDIISAILLDIMCNSQNMFLQLMAAKGLIKFGYKSEIIVKLLDIMRNNKDEFTLILVAFCLGKLSSINPDIIAVCLNIMRNYKVENFWIKAADIWQKNRDEKAFMDYINCKYISFIRNHLIGLFAVKFLGEFGANNSDAISLLLEFIRNPNINYLRTEALFCLSKIAPKNTEYIASLVDILRNSKDESIRREAAESLGKIAEGHPEAIASLVDILRNTKDESIRREAAESLSKIAEGHPEAIASLVDILRNSKDESIRREAAESLGKIAEGHPEAIASLLDIMRNSKDKSIRKEAAESLSKIAEGHPEAIAGLLEVIRNYKSEYFPSNAVESLSKIAEGHPEAIAGLLDIIRNSKDEKTRRQAAYGLEQIGQENAGAIASLLEILRKTKDKITRRQAAISLGNIAKNDEQICEVITGFKTYICQDIYQNEPEVFSTIYEVIWDWAQTLPYPVFYQAWQRGE